MADTTLQHKDVKTKEIGNMEKLADKIGASKAAEMIGLSPNGFSNMLKEGKARIAYDMAAELCLRKMTPRSERAATAYLVKLNPEQAKFIIPMLDFHKIFYMDLNDDA